MGKCYLVGAGDFTPFEPTAEDTVIAADGGLDYLLPRGIRPTLLVGDLDSLRSDVPLGIPLVRHPVKKDETDMHLCYLEGAKIGEHDFVIIGGTGGRPDHTFANYSLLLHIVKDGNRAVMLDGKFAYTAVYNGSFKISEKELARGKGISVFAIGGRALGVRISGLEYESAGCTLECDFPLGVSNKSIGADASISVEDGALLIMWER